MFLAGWSQDGGQQHLPCHSQQEGEVGKRKPQKPPVTHFLRLCWLELVTHLLESVTGKEEIDFQTFLIMTHSQKHTLPKISWSSSHTHKHTRTHVHTCKLKAKFHSSQESASRVHSCMGRDGRPSMFSCRATFYMGCRCWIDP